MRLEARESPGVIAAVLALPARGGVEAQAKPGEVVENGGLVLRACTASDPSLQCATAGVRSIARRPLVEERRIGVAEVQRAVGRGAKRKDRL